MPIIHKYPDTLMTPQDFSPKFFIALIITGILAGLTGMVLTHLLHWVQHGTFVGWTLETIHHVPFADVVAQASSWQRVMALMSGGVVAGLGWWGVHRLGAPLLEVKHAVQQPENNMPFKTTICHALLQIITVGMGSPLGREVAPREMSVALATRLSGSLNMSLAQKQVLLACASGAGLAAVYNVPLAATVFVLETLLLTVSVGNVLAALLCCGVAVSVARWGLGDLVQYAPLPHLAHTHVNTALLWWSLPTGIILAASVEAFQWLIRQLPPVHYSGKNAFFTIIAFSLIGGLSIPFPDILGNGKAGVFLSLNAQISWQMALGLLTAKTFAILLATAVGAYGGRITPSMMLGSLIALLLAIAWNALLPEIAIGLAALVGASVFLGLAQNMCLTALVFLLELSRLNTAYWLPMCACMAVAMATQTLWHRATKTSSSP